MVVELVRTSSLLQLVLPRLWERSFQSSMGKKIGGGERGVSPKNNGQTRHEGVGLVGFILERGGGGHPQVSDDIRKALKCLAFIS